MQLFLIFWREISILTIPSGMMWIICWKFGIKFKKCGVVEKNAQCQFQIFPIHFQKIRNYSEIIPKYSKIFQISPKYSKFSKIFLFFPKYSKLFQNIPKYSKIFQNIPNRSKVFQNIPKYSTDTVCPQLWDAYRHLWSYVKGAVKLRATALAFLIQRKIFGWVLWRATVRFGAANLNDPEIEKWRNEF